MQDGMQDIETLMRDKLDTHCREQLSALLDGELAPDQARFLLRRLQHDRELGGCWERWQVCGDLLRGSAHALLPEGFSERVRSALHGEDIPAQALAAQGHASRARWLPWAGSAALAASVAAVALMVGRGAPQAPSPGPVAFDRVAAAPATTLPLASIDTGSGDAAPSQPAAPGSTPAAAAGTLATAALAAATGSVRRGERRHDREAASLRTATAGPRTILVADSAAEPGGATYPDAEAGAETPAATIADASLVLASPLPQSLPGLASGGDPLLAEARARPWPRSPLPGLAGGTFNAGLQVERPDYEAFEPQLPPPRDSEPVATESLTP